KDWTRTGAPRRSAWKFKVQSSRFKVHAAAGERASDDKAFRHVLPYPVIGPRFARLYARGAAQDPRPHQTQHERKSLSALAESPGRDPGRERRAVAALSEPNRTTLARETGPKARLPARQHHRGQRFR